MKAESCYLFRTNVNVGSMNLDDNYIWDFYECHRVLFESLSGALVIRLIIHFPMAKKGHFYNLAKNNFYLRQRKDIIKKESQKGICL